MSHPFIHPTAIVSPHALIAPCVSIGPYCVVGDGVRLERGVRLISHISIEGITTLGENTVVYPFASIGHPPQDLKYANEPSVTLVGANTTIREYVTIQPGTKGDKMATRVGDNCLLMVGSHVAHDCVVGNHVVMANNATLAGHVSVEDHVIIGGLSAIQQFVRIGPHAIIGGMSGVERDVIPFGLVMGERASLQGLNIVGLKRHGFETSLIQRLLSCYRLVFEEDSNRTFIQRILALRELQESFEENASIDCFIRFFDDLEKRHFCMPKKEK